MYIDQSYTGSSSNGTYVNPYTTIEEALGSVDLTSTKDKIFHVFPGTYTEAFTIANAQKITLEGGTSGFTLQLPSDGAITISTSENIELRDFTIDGSLTGEALLQATESAININDMIITATKRVLTATNGAVAVSDSTITTSSAASSLLFGDTLSSFLLEDSKMQGGGYAIDLRTPETATIDSTTFTGFANGAIFMDTPSSPVLSDLTIENIPHSTLDTAGIYLSGGSGARILNVAITGTGASNPACSSTEQEKGIKLSSHNSAFIEHPTISSIGCNAIIADGSQNTQISRFALDGNGRTIEANGGSIELFDGKITNSTENGLLFADLFAQVDLTTISGTVGGAGLSIVNTTTGNDTAYFISNGCRFDNNQQQAITVSGASTSPGFRVVIRFTQFDSNTGFAIESDVPASLTDFTCASNVFTNQSSQIHSNLSGSNCSG